jgi:hypothetical protein
MKMNRAVRPLVFAALVLSVLLSASSPSFAQVFVSVRFGPPALPVYAQPFCPGPGYFWTPGYWAWNDDAGYYWVPGTWVIAPVGMLWTPGYWGWGGGFYRWHGGYWGPHVGFYGGINYGFGYGGFGFEGGEWRGRSFYYNRSVTNVNVTNVTNVYNRTVINNTTINRVSYNGGTGGITARPTPQEQAFEREPHRTALAAQTQHEQAASHNRQLFASENHGRPAIAATARPGQFSGRNVVAAKAEGAPYHAPAMSPRDARGPANVRPGNANNGNSNNQNVNRPGSASGKQNANQNWRGTAPHQNQNGPRPAGQAGTPSNPSRPPRAQNRAQPQSQAHPSPQPHQNAPRSPSKPPQPRGNPSGQAERHPGPGR